MSVFKPKRENTRTRISDITDWEGDLSYVEQGISFEQLKVNLNIN